MLGLAVIPARGGSKRIPHKNIKDFNGKPLIAYSIENALQSKIFTDVIVSTDDSKIAQVAKSYGAQIPFMRDASLADDYVGTGPVVENAFLKIEEITEKKYDFVCAIYATAPLLTPKYLQEAFLKFSQMNADFLYSCCEFPFPIQRAQYLDSNGTPHPFMPDCMAMRSQDLKKAYQDAGQFYFYSRDLMLHKKKEMKSRVYEMPRYRVVDIDTLEDFTIATALYKTILEMGLE